MPAWFGLGAVCVAWRFHLGGRWTPMGFWSGFLVGNSGSCYTWSFLYVWQND